MILYLNGIACIGWLEPDRRGHPANGRKAAISAVTRDGTGHLLPLRETDDHAGPRY